MRQEQKRTPVGWLWLRSGWGMEMKDGGGFAYKGECAHERLPRGTDSSPSLTTVNQSSQRTMNFNHSYTILTSLIRHSFMVSLSFLF